jgi:hypothetical protein
MVRNVGMALAIAIAVASSAMSAERLSKDPFTPIEAKQDIVGVSFVEFATIPNADGDEAPRLMHMIDEPATQRLFVSTMRGVLYSLSYDGRTVTPYLDIDATNWSVGVQFSGPERGVQSFAFHPEFDQRGKPGYGKFYTYLDTTNVKPAADFTSGSSSRPHDTVLLEWTAKDARAKLYDGGMPKELFRVAHPFGNHNGGQIAFNPLAKPGSADFGLLYVGFADGGSGGDPMQLAQNLASAFGKILRIDPLGSNSTNGRYGVPPANPFVSDGKSATLGEIYAYGLRNPQRLTWDAKDGQLYVADIGQNQVEEISPVTAGANLGWNTWEGSYRYVNRQVDLDNARGAAGLTWPVVEYDHDDPLLQRGAAITGLNIYRGDAIAQLRNLMIFGDIPSGELFYVNADRMPAGGHGAIRRLLLKDGSDQKTLLQLVREKNSTQRRAAAGRVDLRFGSGPKGEIFLLNKRDGVIRLLVPDGAKRPQVG